MTPRKKKQREKYVFRSGSRIAGIEPDVAVSALMEIKNKHGRLNARDIVDEASDPSHPLHPAFQWDDRKAGDAYRLWQARHLSRSVEVIRVETGDAVDPPSEPIFVSTVKNKESYYSTVGEVIAEEETYIAAMSQLQRKRDQLERMINYLKSRAESTPGFEDRVAALAIASETALALRAALERATVTIH
jgi:hypothetical protein